MKLRSLIALLTIVIASAIAGGSSTDALGKVPQTSVICGGSCGDNGGQPNCSALTLGWSYTYPSGYTVYCEETAPLRYDWI